jgi:hypothetical protein
MLRAFYTGASRTPQPTVLLVEHPFAVPLYDPITGEVLEEVLAGTLDLVVDGRGRPLIVEHKTSSRRYSDDQLTYDLQMSGYKYAARQLPVGDADLRFQILTKTKVPEVQLADVQRGPASVDVFLTTCIGVLHAVDQGIDYPLPSWQCRTCPFAYACGAGQT